MTCSAGPVAAFIVVLVVLVVIAAIGWILYVNKGSAPAPTTYALNNAVMLVWNNPNPPSGATGNPKAYSLDLYDANNNKTTINCGTIGSSNYVLIPPTEAPVGAKFQLFWIYDVCTNWRTSTVYSTKLLPITSTTFNSSTGISYLDLTNPQNLS